MVLNRAVCIDYPEFDVPWFHTKYCEEMQSLSKIFIFIKQKFILLLITIKLFIYLFFSF